EGGSPLTLPRGGGPRGAVRCQPHRGGRSHAPGHRDPLRAPGGRLPTSRRRPPPRTQATLPPAARQLLAAPLPAELPGARPPRRRRPDRARPGRSRVQPQALSHHREGAPQPRRLHPPPAHRRPAAAAPGACREAALCRPRTAARAAPPDRPPARGLHARAEPARRAPAAPGAQPGRLLRDAAPHRRRGAERPGRARLAGRGHPEAPGTLRGRRMIAFGHVSKVFGSGDTAVRAVDNLSFECPAGGFWALTGPSGSGKSTVLHLIAGLTPPTSGRVLVDGAD